MEPLKFVSNRTATVVTLVDPAVSGHQPVPQLQMSHVFDSYHPEAGVLRYVPHGSSYPAVSPQSVIIAQASNAAAKAVMNSLIALAADLTEQPFQVQWDDNHAGGIYDGPWWVFDISGEVESDWPGYIDPLTLSMSQADPADVQLSSLTVQADGVAVGTLAAMRVTIG